MTVQSIDSLSASTASSLYTNKRNDAMDKADFLNLLITQLQQQDPLNPQDPTEFTSQLTQFSSLEQMMSLNQAVQTLQALQMSTNNTLASGLIGKDILYSSDKVTLTQGGSANVHFSADSAAQNATVTIYNSAGQVVRTIQVPSVSEGDNTIAWDGKGNDQSILPPGTYTVSVTAKDASGNTITYEPAQLGHVSGIIFRNGQTFLDVDGKEIALGDIFSVHESTTPAAAA